MEIIEYFGSDRKEHWFEQLKNCKWEAGKLICSLLKNGTQEQFLGKSPRLFLLTDGDELVSFCTLAEKDDIPDTELKPWIGFVFTFPKYCGNHCIRRLIEHAERIAFCEGYNSVHISTCHTGLYEKYGYDFFGYLKDINGEDSRIYIKKLKETTEMHEKMKEYIYSNRERLLAMIYELVAVHSVKGEPSEGAPFGIGPRAALDKMISICRREGFETKLCHDVIGTADLCSDDEFPALGILCHLDVVPAEGQEGWNSDPFKMIEKDGKIYGRGVVDDKGPAAAVFLAMKCIQTLGIPLKKGVRFIFGTDEENGSGDLDIYLAKEKLPENIFTPDASFPIINIEKGMMRSRFSGSYRGGNVLSFRGGSIPNAVPDTAECVLTGIDAALIKSEADADCTGAKFTIKEYLDHVRIKCNGRSAHASTPESGINAVTALISFLCKLPLEQGSQRDLLHGLVKRFPYGETDGNSIGVKCSDERSGALTLVLSIFNMENGKCDGCIDVRFPTCMTLADVEAAEKSALEKANCRIEGYMGDEPHITDENSEFVQKLLKVYERVEGEKGHCIAIGGGTYVHGIKGGVAFGVERDGIDYHMHGANEFITVDELLKDALLYAEAIVEICG